LLLNDVIEAIDGVVFFFSSISGVCSNPNVSTDPNKTANNDTYPCVAFFIVYESSEKCNEETFFAALHNQDVEPEITPIKVRNRGKPDLETAARQLFQTLKDHNNATVQEMVDMSNTYCYQNAPASSSETEDEDKEENEEFVPTHFPTCPSCFVIVNHDGYLQELDNAIEKLQSDGLVVETTLRAELDTRSSGTHSNDVLSIIRKVERVMYLSKHALYRGQIYARPNTAQFTYISLLDVSSYLNKLLANDAINKHLVKHLKTVESILSHPACEIIPQIHFDFNLIEVSNGFCFAISSRAFLPNAIRESNIGKLSPRAYIPYDCSSPPEPRYFREGVYNSFPDEEVRLKFLNKFYQCLLAHKMPQKTRKLVVSGPRDSGKTSWAYVFHRIIPPQYIASVTNERQFSASMINDDTQLVMIDEWSASTMSSDLAKTILQGGWMITAVKHAAPRHINCHSPFYITTNTVPDFHEENENVERRIEIFTTSSLSTITPGIDQWIYNNAMDCIAWIAEEINTHCSLIPSEERWYEDEDTLNSVVPSLDIVAQWERGNIVEIREADLDPQQTTYAKTPLIDENIHSGFITEAKTRRLARKRRRRRQIYSNDSSCEEDDPSNFSTFLDREKNICSQTSQTQAIPPANNEPQMYNEMNEDSQTFDERPLLCQGEIIPPANIEPTCTDLAQTIPPANVQPTSTELAQSPVEVHVPPADNHPSQTQAIPPANNEPRMYNEMNEDSQTSEERPLLCQDEIIPPANIEPTCIDLAQTTPPTNVQPTSTELAQSPVEVHVPPADNHPSTSTGITQAPVSDETNDTPDVWKLNDKVYMGRVADLITFNFYKDLQRGHVHSFTERVRQAKMRRDVKEQHFWVKADPEIDAWMLATNRKRDVFDIDAFVEYQPHILPHLKRLRQTLNVLVLTSRCLVTNALNKRMNHDADQETNDGPQLSSQSYWTTFKTWWR
jgi:hypothetical protein